MSRGLTIRVVDKVSYQEKRTMAWINGFRPPKSLENYEETIRSILGKKEENRLPKEKAIVKQFKNLLGLFNYVEYPTLEETILKNIDFGFYGGGRINCILNGHSHRLIVMESFLSSNSTDEIYMEQSQIKENLAIIPEAIKLLFMIMNLEEENDFNIEIIKTEKQTYDEKELARKFQEMKIQFEEKNGKYIPRISEGFSISEYESLWDVFESKSMEYPQIDTDILNKVSEMATFFKRYPFFEDEYDKKHSKARVGFASYLDKRAKFYVGTHVEGFRVYNSEEYVPVGLYTKEEVTYFQTVLKLYNELFELLYKRNVILKKDCKTTVFEFISY